MRNGERDAAPRLNPRLNPRQLWMMANDPDWRPWMILIVNHRNAWPELRAWFAAGRGDRPARRAPAAGHADRAAATGRHGHVHTHGTRGPRVGRRGDRDAGTGTPIDDLAAVADEAGPAATHVAWKPVAIGIAATLAAVAWNRIGRVRAERAEQAALETARSDCARASKSLRAAMDAYEALKAGKAADTAKTTAKQVEDARTVAALDKALNAKEPKAVACTADTRAGYERQTSRVDANRDWYKEHKASLAKAVEAVGESRDAKTITDAKKLLNDSKGKVQDERTRDALDKAIKAKDTQAITKAVKAVDDSVKAKERKDAEAKAKAEAEAEAKEKAREQAQARQDGGSSGSVPQSGYSATSGSAGRYSPTGSAGSDGSASTPAPSAPSQSTPSWDVPSTGGQDGLPDRDPSM